MLKINSVIVLNALTFSLHQVRTKVHDPWSFFCPLSFSRLSNLNYSFHYLFSTRYKYYARFYTRVVNFTRWDGFSSFTSLVWD
uniref:Uncharacterized protein n=1 Tax=Utricularia reniformis TaxID=192314 RepID=A0A1Y0B4I2_9LAMI|nr:hypothetical protein AEK19_MT2084 [Utricularia reniformis]ART32239.1 hypothetical protein AEK19_MT2084 [Utricularia reniformis]